MYQIIRKHCKHKNHLYGRDECALTVNISKVSGRNSCECVKEQCRVLKMLEAMRPKKRNASTSTNVCYAAALEVIREFEKSSEYNFDILSQYCVLRLNSPQESKEK